MINHYPLWKYTLIAIIIIIGLLYAFPNLYQSDPAVQIKSAGKDWQVDESLKNRITSILDSAELKYRGIELDNDAKRITIRFENADEQAKARQFIAEQKLTDGALISDGYLIAFSLVPTTPGWLAALGGAPMNLGLDLRGGVYFLMDVDLEAATQKATEAMKDDARRELRAADLHYLTVTEKDKTSIYMKFESSTQRDKARQALGKKFNNVNFEQSDEAGKGILIVSRDEDGLKEVRDNAVSRNIITLRKRIDALGVAEPVVQRQGDRRIVVELPGVQDPEQAKDIISATATLEFRMVAKSTGSNATKRGTYYKMREGNQKLFLENRTMATGESVTSARAGFDSRSSSPAVFITIDDGGRFDKISEKRVGDNMAIVFIENKKVTRLKDGKPVIIDGKLVKDKKVIKEVISNAVIRERLGRSFQITGLDSPSESARLALLLQAGALAAPVDIVEERTIGPTLGEENINRGFMSVVVGFILVLVFMAVYYRGFGLVADLALMCNLVLIIAVMSILGTIVQVALTLPGIAGIVLTVGMAVDANVLIFERIREELRNGNTPQSSIQAGYDKALSTIADANITTLIAAVVLYLFGTGAIQGFAVTLSIGIVTSMFTAIMGTRAVVNLLYGGKRVSRLSI